MLTDKEMADLRRWALEKATSEAPGGSKWEIIFHLAERYMAFVLGQADPGPYMEKK